MLSRFFLTRPQRDFINDVRSDLSASQLAFITRGFRKGFLGMHKRNFGLSDALNCDVWFPQLIQAKHDPSLEDTLAAINEDIEHGAFERARQAFSKHAFERITAMIGTHIVCPVAVKQACALQLVCPERIHVLLLGDPDIGRPQLVKSASRLHPHGAFASGLVVRRDKTLIDVLSAANDGLLGIDELHVLSDSELSTISNVMEKGVIVQGADTSQSSPHRPEAQARILASANPKGERFIGKDIRFLRQQIPFHSTLLSRFHAVFIMRAVTVQDLDTITASLQKHALSKDIEQDIAFVQRYVASAEQIPVDFPKALHQDVVDWATQVKEQEDKILVVTSPRMIQSVSRMAQAHARVHLRREVTKQDLTIAFDIMEASFRIPVPKTVVEKVGA